jgi:hypothetical protein
MINIQETCFQANVILGKTPGPASTRWREEKHLSLQRIEVGYSID